MRKRVCFGLALLFILLVVSATYTPTLATTYELGVRARNTATYSVSETIVVDTKFVLTVVSVSGTMATVNASWYFSNGTLDEPASFSAPVDVNSSIIVLSLFLIAKGLTKGDPIYPTATDIINDAATMTVAGASRTVDEEFTGFDSFYWDQATGITAGFNLGFPGDWLNITMTSTNMWSSGWLSTTTLSKTTLLLIGGVVIAVVMVAVAVVLVRRRK